MIRLQVVQLICKNNIKSESLSEGLQSHDSKVNIYAPLQLFRCFVLSFLTASLERARASTDHFFCLRTFICCGAA